MRTSFNEMKRFLIQTGRKTKLTRCKRDTIYWFIRHREMRFLAALFLLFTLPALAQDNGFPRIEIAIGYGQVRLPYIFGFTNPSCRLGVFCAGRIVATSGGRHSGFASQQTINFNRWLGIENYLGYYGAGPGASVEHIVGRSVTSTFFTDVFGGKVAARTSKRIIPVPYGVVGFGGSSLSSFGQGSVSGIATRLAGGLEIPFNGSMSLRVDYSRISSQLFGQWQNSEHFTAGVAFVLAK